MLGSATSLERGAAVAAAVVAGSDAESKAVNRATKPTVTVLLPALRSALTGVHRLPAPASIWESQEDFDTFG